MSVIGMFPFSVMKEPKGFDWSGVKHCIGRFVIISAGSYNGLLVRGGESGWRACEALYYKMLHGRIQIFGP